MHDRPIFERVLVANRGEIAVRVIRALRDMRIESVAVYSDADRRAPHVRMADRAVRIGPAAASESYLKIDAIVAAAKTSGAGAVHPGYGFLSENAAFARAVRSAGLVFIGPSPESIEAVGDKAAARRVAEKVGVPVTPGWMGDDSDASLALAAAKIGLPVLLKPAGGGGGKGMKVVATLAELPEAAAGARREAERAFGNAALILEKYVFPARHIEVQVFGDSLGGVTAVGERECSLQRRHQKIIEECPSAVVDDALRARLETAAKKIASAVRYVGAGTCEFLLGPDGDFYFLEMNTRLQVEHPVTELVYGVDLVRAQIEVAAGRALPEWLVAAKPRGHAIEARLYAEDPAHGFLPTPGKIRALVAPAGPGVRFESGLEGPSEITADYDPMIAKLCAYGSSRSEAAARLVRALRETVLLGTVTNVEFLLDLAAEPFFLAADFHTHSTAPYAEAWAKGRAAAPVPLEVLAAATLAQTSAGGAATRDPGIRPADAGRASADPFDVVGPWRGLGQGEAS